MICPKCKEYDLTEEEVICGYCAYDETVEIVREMEGNKKRKGAGQMPKQWTEYFLEIADLVATKSKDKSRQVGCVLVGPDHEVLSTGYNGMCRGLNDDVPERHERPEKYYWFEHAERNAVYNAARAGVKLKGATAYMQSAPCADCARALIQAGVTRIHARRANDFLKSRWVESIECAKIMLAEAGVELTEW
jgi:dCMP deaminase